MKYIKYVLAIIVLTLVVVALAGMYKFNYLTNKEGYNADGNKILVQPESEIIPNENKERILTDYMCIGEFCDGSGSYNNYLEMGNSFTLPVFTQGGDIGCGMQIINIPHYSEPKTSGVLNEAYKKLFTLEPYSEIVSDGLENPVGFYRYLYFKQVTIENGLAKVYLEGSLIGPGHCSLAILRAQIPVLAFQFDSIQAVEVYLNSTLYNWCKMDESNGEGSCPEIPQFWRAEK
jgi:hypothetical protein